MEWIGCTILISQFAEADVFWTYLELEPKEEDEEDDEEREAMQRRRGEDINFARGDPLLSSSRSFLTTPSLHS